MRDENCYVGFGIMFDQGFGIRNRRDGFIEVRVVIDACDPCGVRRAGVSKRQESQQHQHGGDHIQTPESVTGMSANASQRDGCFCDRGLLSPVGVELMEAHRQAQNTPKK